MNMMQETFKCSALSEIEGADRDRKWFQGLGISSIILGVAALCIPVVTTVAIVSLLGSFLLISGVVQGYQTLKVHEGKQFFLHLVISIFYVIVGTLMISKPGAGALSLALLLAAFFMVGGLLRILAAVAMRFRSWGWVVFNGIVTFFLGLVVWADWPISGLWVIGLFVGIEMVINGWALVMFATEAREELAQIRRQCEVPV